MAKNWNMERAKDRINGSISALPLNKIEIREYVRDANLRDLPRHVAYRVNGVHLYVDILNLRDMLNVTAVEGETCHKRTLRFLNLHYRAVHRILDRVDVVRVDFHNQRLHAVVAKPYDSEAERIHRAIATGQLITDVLSTIGEGEEYPSARVRIGIDSGTALAVNNGRRGHREPLFLGEPANQAAKRASCGSSVGIYLTNRARVVAGLEVVGDEDVSALTASEISASREKARLGVTADEIVDEWKEDLEKSPIGSFIFSGHTPPFKDLDIEELSPKNSRRNEAATIYADIDGFTDYVAKNISSDESAKHVVRALHVLRGELDAVLHSDFEGRKVRFIGDCIHGLMADGTAQTTEVERTISNMTLCASAMRSSFRLAIDRLADNGTDAKSLGLAIGFEFGPMTVTRLGMKGDLVRCSVSRGVLAAEEEQRKCSGAETAMGLLAYANASVGVRRLFGSGRRVQNLTYDVAVEALDSAGDETARLLKREALTRLAPTIHVAHEREFRPHSSIR